MDVEDKQAPTASLKPTKSFEGLMKEINEVLQEDNSKGKEQEGRKDDAEKVRLDLIPPEIIFALGDILTFGANKYSDRNWEKGMDWGRVFGALMRHLWCWWGGHIPTNENFVFGECDEETKRSHLWHAACCITFLVTFEERGIGKDDRGG